MTTPVQLVLVDFDDTIVDTAPRFSRARRELFQFLEASGFSAEEAERMHHDVIDPGMRAEYGFGPQRLEHAFLATYEQLREKAGLALREEVAERCRELGRAVAGTPAVFDGALSALRTLAARHPTVLYTQSGDALYQMRCVRESGVLDVLPEDRVRIAVRKCTEDFVATLRMYGVEDAAGVWMIGNSMRSDVNPALEAGANAILIETAEPWHYDMVEPAADHFHRAATFAAAVDWLLDLPS
jgi:putative hydrolase of the HAD superfamily